MELRRVAGPLCEFKGIVGGGVVLDFGKHRDAARDKSARQSVRAPPRPPRLPPPPPQAGKVFKKNSWGTHYKVRIPPENPWMQVTLLKELGPAQWRRWVASMNDLAASPHRTLVRPIGHSQSGDVHAVVQVYYGVGTLQDVLDDPQLTWKMRLTVARTVAEGVAWMHTALAPPMFHGMLAAKSVTITEQWHAKVGAGAGGGVVCGWGAAPPPSTGERLEGRPAGLVHKELITKGVGGVWVGPTKGPLIHP